MQLQTEECEGHSCHRTNLSNPDPVQHSILQTIYEKLWGISGLKAFHPSHSENAFKSASWLVRLTSIIQIRKQDHAQELVWHTLNSSPYQDQEFLSQKSVEIRQEANCSFFTYRPLYHAQDQKPRDFCK